MCVDEARSTSSRSLKVLVGDSSGDVPELLDIKPQRPLWSETGDAMIDQAGIRRRGCDVYSAGR